MDYKGLRPFELLRSSWAGAMDRLTKDLSRTQLYCALTGFIIIGAFISIYAGLRGLSAQSPASIQIDAVSEISSPYSEQRNELDLLEMPLKNNRAQSRLDRYIDSVIKAPAVMEPHKQKNIEMESCSAGFLRK